jgi:arginine metabolism regulation protein II
MSRQMKESTGTRSVMDILLHLDNESEKQGGTGELARELTLGPFGVFQAKSRPVLEMDAISSPRRSVSPESFDSLPDVGVAGDTEGPVEDILRSDWNQVEALGHPDIEMFLDVLDPSLCDDDEQRHDEPGMSSFLNSDSPFLDLLYPPAIHDASHDASSSLSSINDNVTLSQRTSNIANQDNSTTMLSLPQSMTTNGVDRQGDGSLGIPEQAEPLLRYYKQQVTDSASAMQAKRKSPWQILFLPCALETFAEVSLWSRASHTRLTILYALLANSAFQLRLANTVDPLSSRWLDLGLQHQDTAKKHLRKALQLEMFGPNQAKYKDLLMAILSMAMVSVRLILISEIF